MTSVSVVSSSLQQHQQLASPRPRTNASISSPAKRKDRYTFGFLELDYQQPYSFFSLPPSPSTTLKSEPIPPPVASPRSSPVLISTSLPVMHLPQCDADTDSTDVGVAAAASDPLSETLPLVQPLTPTPTDVDTATVISALAASSNSNTNDTAPYNFSLPHQEITLPSWANSRPTSQCSSISSAVSVTSSLNHRSMHRIKPAAYTSTPASLFTVATRSRTASCSSPSTEASLEYEEKLAPSFSAFLSSRPVPSRIALRQGASNNNNNSSSNTNTPSMSSVYAATSPSLSTYTLSLTTSVLTTSSATSLSLCSSSLSHLAQDDGNSHNSSSETPQRRPHRRLSYDSAKKLDVAVKPSFWKGLAKRRNEKEEKEEKEDEEEYHDSEEEYTIGATTLNDHDNEYASIDCDKRPPKSGDQEKKIKKNKKRRPTLSIFNFMRK
ncbi:hypothetical protein BGZ99_008461 [Dissophora globulifera]|uniref:Uncharacterized protein n=1 Tax=Dissophora globulifera TaxID=979702 RepID=A0A9P6UPM2_9FUNG|nr:hypothetical protein BGZ99_008461 [Dissophora globulifera]